MKSRTSFFNTTVLRKDITRFMPVWILYSVGLLLFMVIPNIGWGISDVADSLAYTLSAAGTLQMIYGGVCAMMVFGDLFKTRLCYATHALPLRREGWFLTHYVAGFLFSFVPNLMASLCLMLTLGTYWYMAALWLAVSTMAFLFFFSLGAFSAVCAGNRLGMTAVYLTLNFGILLVKWYAEEVYMPLLSGVIFDLTVLEVFAPTSFLAGLDFIDFTTSPFQYMGIITGDWIYLAILAVLGVVIAFLAVLLYRKRNLETAGDFLAFSAIKPVFLVIYTLTFCYIVYSLISLPVVALLIGLTIGFFTGRMLLDRTVRVFKGKNFLFMGVMITVIAITIGLTALDPLGLSRYVPETDKVDSVSFYSSGDRYQADHYATSDPAKIDQFREFHADLVENNYPIAEDEDTIAVYLEYTLESGRTVLREYTIPVDSAPGQFVRQAMSRWEYVFKTNDWDGFVASIENITVELYSELKLSDPAQIRGLLEAIKADCEAGNMAQYWALHQDEDPVCYVHIHDPEFKYSSDYHYQLKVFALNLDIYASCEHTIAYLKTIGLNVNAVAP